MSKECQTAGDALVGVFNLLGKRWTGLIIGVLLDNGEVRFAELQRAIPRISERMLSERLTELAAEGLVTRDVAPGPPVGVAYRLTPKGEALRPALTELMEWASEHLVGTRSR